MTKLKGDPIGVAGAIIDAPDAVPSGTVLAEKIVPDPASSSTPSATSEAPESAQWTLQSVCDREEW